MARNRGEELEEHHNQGEKDAPDTYNPPHTIVPILDDIFFPSIQPEMEEDNDKYDEGWSNTYKQS